MQFLSAGWYISPSLAVAMAKASSSLQAGIQSQPDICAWLASVQLQAKQWISDIVKYRSGLSLVYSILYIQCTVGLTVSKEKNQYTYLSSLLSWM